MILAEKQDSLTSPGHKRELNMNDGRMNDGIEWIRTDFVYLSVICGVRYVYRVLPFEMSFKVELKVVSDAHSFLLQALHKYCNFRERSSKYYITIWIFWTIIVCEAYNSYFSDSTHPCLAAMSNIPQPFILFFLKAYITF